MITRNNGNVPRLLAEIVGAVQVSYLKKRVLNLLIWLVGITRPMPPVSTSLIIRSGTEVKYNYKGWAIV